LKFGGGRVLTKQPSDENALKCPLTLGGVNKIVEGNALVVCDTQASPNLKEKVEVTPLKPEIKSKMSGLETIVAELYDLEGVVTEKPMKIDLDLDLYQMEKV
jgi:hypothetical protein